MEGGTSKDITTLLVEWSNGKASALDELAPLVYDAMRQMAARALQHERPGHTLQPTALVHEAYLKLLDQSRITWQDSDHFFAVASQILGECLSATRAPATRPSEGVGARS